MYGNVLDKRFPVHGESPAIHPSRRNPSNPIACKDSMANDYPAANGHCPSYFSRRAQSARASHRSLISGLRELHLRQALQRDCTGIPLVPPALTSSVDVERGGHYGVTIDFITEVSRHCLPSATVNGLSASVLDPASKPHRSSFVAIPGLTHARFKGPPEFIVAYDPASSFHAVAHALQAHARSLLLPPPSAIQGQQQLEPHRRPAPTYWLPCFACNAHEALRGQAEVRVASARAASETASSALLLLDGRGAALTLAWPMADMIWVLKNNGVQVSPITMGVD